MRNAPHSSEGNATMGRLVLCADFYFLSEFNVL